MKTVAFLRGSHTASIIADARRIGLVCPADVVIVLATADDRLREAGDIDVSWWDPTEGERSVVLVANGGFTAIQVASVVRAIDAHAELERLAADAYEYGTGPREQGVNGMEVPGFTWRLVIVTVERDGFRILEMRKHKS